MSGEEKLNHYLKSKILDGIKINKNVEKILINIMNSVETVLYPELKCLKTLITYANENEIEECFKKYKTLTKSQKISNSIEYYISCYGNDYGKIKHKEYRNNNANAVSLAGRKKNGSNSAKTRSIWCIEYYISRGYSIEEGNKIISELQKNNNTYRQKYTKSIKILTGTSLQYYLNKGLSIDEAKLRLSERQSTFSLSKCIEKYGEEQGKLVWSNRQIKWQTTLSNKTEFEKIEINRKRIMKIGVASKESLKYFIPLYKKLRKLGVHRKDIHFGVYGSSEYFLRSDNNFFLYDFTILHYNIIIEYNGAAWHTKNPDDTRLNPYGICLSECYKKDKIKKELALKNGFSYFELWGGEHDMNIKTINNILYEIENNGLCRVRY